VTNPSHHEVAGKLLSLPLYTGISSTEIASR